MNGPHITKLSFYPSANFHIIVAIILICLGLCMVVIGTKILLSRRLESAGIAYIKKSIARSINSKSGIELLHVKETLHSSDVLTFSKAINKKNGEYFYLPRYSAALTSNPESVEVQARFVKICNDLQLRLIDDFEQNDGVRIISYEISEDIDKVRQICLQLIGRMFPAFRENIDISVDRL